MREYKGIFWGNRLAYASSSPVTGLRIEALIESKMFISFM